MEELGVTVEDLETKPTDVESKNKALKELRGTREALYEEVERFWKTFEVGDDEQNTFEEKLETAGRLKQAGLTLLKEEVSPLWDKESEKLMEELGVTVEDLELKPTDAESKNKAVKDLEEKKEQESSRLEKEVKRLLKTLEVREGKQKVFDEKVEAAGKLKQDGLTLVKEQRDKMAVEMREKAEMKAFLSSTTLKCLKGHELKKESSGSGWYCDCCLKYDSFGEMMVYMSCEICWCKECTWESTSSLKEEKGGHREWEGRVRGVRGTG